MTLVECRPGTVTIELPTAGSARAADAGVIWMRGEHDVDTLDALAAALRRATAHGAGDVVVDLSEVDFMSAATAGLLARTRLVLRRESRSLVLRAPSRCAERILDLCGIGGGVSV